MHLGPAQKRVATEEIQTADAAHQAKKHKMYEQEVELHVVEEVMAAAQTDFTKRYNNVVREQANTIRTLEQEVQNLKHTNVRCLVPCFSIQN